LLILARHNTPDSRAKSEQKMPVLRFTDLSIRSLKEGSYYDDRTPGFGIRVGKRRRTWHVVKQPSRTKITIGFYPDLSLADARRKALIALGTPAIQGETKTPGFPEARNEYLAQGKWRARTRSEMTRLLTAYFSWTKTIDKISHKDVADAVEGIGKPSEAEHAFKYIKSFFNWCVPRYLKHSPCAGLKPPSRYTPRERVLSDDELCRLWNAARELHTFGLIVRALLITGQRRGELSRFQQAWIKDSAITFPGAIVKNKRDHRIPVGPLALELLQRLPSKYNGWGTPKAKLDKLSGVTGWTLHDLRRTYATNLQRLGVKLEVIERLLNHISGPTRAGIIGTYQRHDFFPEMQQAVAKYETWLISLIAR
jgi:integrase